jgi:divalent metal cation (Fe/Co/Zn/Cd) transporter
MEEISAENLAELKKRYKVTVFIVSAQMFSAFVLIIAAWLVAKEDSAAERSYLTLWLVILFLSAVTFVLRRRLFNWERLKNTALLKGVSGVIGLLQINTIILTLFAEIVVIIGFIIALLNGNVFDMLRACGIAAIVFALNFPRRAIWEKIVSNLEKI